VKVVLTDIEGTTTPITFVKDILFPAARARLPEWVRANPDDAEVRALTAEHDGLEGAITQLLAWSDADAKITALKSIQGRLWAQGYADGSLKAPLYPDVSPKLRAWQAAGVRLAVFSSGSVAAQQMLFGHTTEGDLRGLFSGWFDTTVGGKRDPAAYLAIAHSLGVPASRVRFLSDLEAELDAAAAAGMTTVCIVRDGQRAPRQHAGATSFVGL
jgi:enolase-phosphatase E1